MDCFSMLQGEHWLIRRFLGHLRALLADAGIVGPWRPELERTAAFLDDFGAAFHDAREDRVLFPFLVERGLDSDARGRPLTHDHAAFAASRRAFAAALAQSDPGALEEALTHLHRLVRLLEDHVVVERALHAELHRRLSEEDEAELDRRLRAAFPDADTVMERAQSELLRLGAPSERPPALPA